MVDNGAQKKRRAVLSHAAARHFMAARTSDRSGRLQQGLCGEAKALDLLKFEVLVLDVHGHVGVHSLQCLQETSPVFDFVSAADCHKLP